MILTTSEREVRFRRPAAPAATAPRLKVLMSAYACEPGRGSEPGVGWNAVRAAAMKHDVWLLTRATKRAMLEEAIAREGVTNLHLACYSLPVWASFFKKKRRGEQVHYYLWQIGAYLAARRLHRRVKFDVVHHVTFVRYWMPSFLSLLPAPFVWGPVGGGESTPRGFRSFFTRRGRISERLRDLARSLFGQGPFVRWTARRAAVALATTPETEEELERLGCRQRLIATEAGVSRQDLGRLETLPFRTKGPFRVTSVGRLIHWKGFELGVRAFAEFEKRYPESEYWLVGDGPEQTRLERLAAELGVGGKVKFWGLVARDAVLDKLAESDVLMHPSLHDSGGWVCLEAMAAGRPVVCLDLGGPATQVTERTGVKVKATDVPATVAGLAGALIRLAGNPALRRRLSEGARQRVRDHYVWEDRGEFLTTVYQMARERGDR